MSLLEEDTIKKKQENKNNKLVLKSRFKISRNKKYKLEVIWDNLINTHEKKSQLPGLYYLISWKSYTKAKSIWEYVLAVMYLEKMISTFYKDYPNKPITISLLTDSTPLMAKLSVSLGKKWKQGCFVKNIKKQVKN